MRKLNILTLFLFMSQALVFSQITQGTAKYAVKTGISMPEISENMKEDQKTDPETAKAMKILNTLMGSGEETILLLDFNNNESFLRPFESIEKDDASFSMTSIIAESVGAIYTDYTSQVSFKVDESLGEKLIVIDSLNRFNWNLTSEQKEIAGYTCFKAIGTRMVHRDGRYRESSVEAWYTPQIPVPSGPAGYGGLPGLIVLLKEKKASIFELTEVTTDKVGKIKKPKGGKRMSKVEYDKLLSSIEDY